MPRIPLTPIAVDDFSYAPGVTIFLLTHLHTDHLKGLSPTWDRGTIYCSELTLELLQKRMPGLDSSVLSPVPDHSSVRVPLDSSGYEYIDIMSLSVSHCLGAVMFLLRGYFGTVLCTGDFRYSASVHSLKGVPELQRDMIDDIYLDDTFLDPRHDFPPWDVAQRQVLSFIEAHEAAHGRLDKILIKVDLWGKEELLVQLANALETLVVVTPERMEMLQVAVAKGLISNVFTTNPHEGRIATVGYRPKDSNLVFKCKTTGLRIVGIIPSGWVGTDPVLSKNERVVRVGYSAHSSYSEILDFVEWLRPRSVVGISRGDGNRAVDEHLARFLRNHPAPPVGIVDRLERGARVPQQVLGALRRSIREKTVAKKSAPPPPGGARRRRAGVVLKAHVPSQQQQSLPEDRPPRGAAKIHHQRDTGAGAGGGVFPGFAAVEQQQQQQLLLVLRGGAAGTPVKSGERQQGDHGKSVTRTPESEGALFGSDDDDDESVSPGSEGSCQPCNLSGRFCECDDGEGGGAGRLTQAEVVHLLSLPQDAETRPCTASPAPSLESEAGLSDPDSGQPPTTSALAKATSKVPPDSLDCILDLKPARPAARTDASRRTYDDRPVQNPDNVPPPAPAPRIANVASTVPPDSLDCILDLKPAARTDASRRRNDDRPVHSPNDDSPSTPPPRIANVASTVPSDSLDCIHDPRASPPRNDDRPVQNPGDDAPSTPPRQAAPRQQPNTPSSTGSVPVSRNLAGAYSVMSRLAKKIAAAPPRDGTPAVPLAGSAAPEGRRGGEPLSQASNDSLSSAEGSEGARTTRMRLSDTDRRLLRKLFTVAGADDDESEESVQRRGGLTFRQLSPAAGERARPHAPQAGAQRSEAFTVAVGADGGEGDASAQRPDGRAFQRFSPAAAAGAGAAKRAQRTEEVFIVAGADDDKSEESVQRRGGRAFPQISPAAGERARPHAPQAGAQRSEAFTVAVTANDGEGDESMQRPKGRAFQRFSPAAGAGVTKRVQRSEVYTVAGADDGKSEESVQRPEGRAFQQFSPAAGAGVTERARPHAPVAVAQRSELFTVTGAATDEGAESVHRPEHAFQRFSPAAGANPAKRARPHAPPAVGQRSEEVFTVTGADGEESVQRPEHAFQQVSPAAGAGPTKRARPHAPSAVAPCAGEGDAALSGKLRACGKPTAGDASRGASMLSQLRQVDASCGRPGLLTDSWRPPTPPRPKKRAKLVHKQPNDRVTPLETRKRLR
ncbi:DNA ligase 6 [Diplonema papillatum]|nr:DNA ligase 6 [Diplonema papillatum]|eukprot:gene15772-24090_t